MKNENQSGFYIRVNIVRFEFYEKSLRMKCYRCRVLRRLRSQQLEDGGIDLIFHRLAVGPFKTGLPSVSHNQSHVVAIPDKQKMKTMMKRHREKKGKEVFIHELRTFSREALPCVPL